MNLPILLKSLNHTLADQVKPLQLKYQSLIFDNSFILKQMYNIFWLLYSLIEGS